jgi:fucose 4-O-acetylase-like acetyltransferase
VEAIRHRIAYIDYARGVLIYLVSVGHSFQFLVVQNQHYFSDGLFKGIYIFHMPLFMAISGYVAHTSICSLPFGRFVRKKALAYLLPIITWAVIWSLLVFLVTGGPSSARPLDGAWLFVDEVSRLWFLWTLLFSLLLTWLANSLGRYRLLGFALIFVAVMLLPNEQVAPLLKYMFPFFVGGFFLAEVEWVRVPARRILLVTLTASCVSVICYFFWKEDTYIYVSGMALTRDNVPVILFRYVSSAVTCVAVAGVLWYLEKVTPRQLKAGIESIGRDSIYIYVLQIYAFLALLWVAQRYFAPGVDPWVNHLVALALGAAVTLACWLAGKALSMSPALAALLFGKPRRRPTPAITGGRQS